VKTYSSLLTPGLGTIDKFIEKHNGTMTGGFNQRIGFNLSIANDMRMEFDQHFNRTTAQKEKRNTASG